MSGFQYWARSFTTSFVPQIEAFAESLSRRVLPGFADIGAEGTRLEEEILAQGGLGNFDDAASAAEHARDQAVTYWTTMYGIEQGVVNLFGVGLWHLFEQQLATFIRHGLRDVCDPPPQKPFEEVQAALRKMGVDIDIGSLAAHAKVDELRLFANCAKHGDGHACSQLRAKRPDLFNHPSLHASEVPWPSALPVIAPLGGEDLYMTPERFQEYATAVIGFWDELARRILEAIAR